MTRPKTAAALADLLGVNFENADLLQQALHHRSYLNEAELSVESNERMEFLGSFCRAELWLACGQRLRADFSINDIHDLSLALGQNLNIALPPARIRLFPAGEMTAAPHG